MRSLSRTTDQPFVTWGLIGLNVLVYLITVAQGSGINSPGGKLFAKWVLFGPAVANGDWWRLITAAFLHANLLHIGLNMLALVWLGAPVERYLGHLQYLALYLVAGLAGSAGALITTPTGITVGASGAIFGILGALLIIEYQATGQIAGQAFTLIVINLLFSFTMSGISVRLWRSRSGCDRARPSPRPGSPPCSTRCPDEPADVGLGPQRRRGWRELRTGSVLQRVARGSEFAARLIKGIGDDDLCLPCAVKPQQAFDDRLVQPLVECADATAKGQRLRELVGETHSWIHTLVIVDVGLRLVSNAQHDVQLLRDLTVRLKESGHFELLNVE